MIRRLVMMGLAGTLCCAAPGSAQTLLELADAVARARAHNPDARAAAVDAQIADARVNQARAGRLPRVDATEGWQRGTQPVFVFGALLGQRQFTAAGFGIDALNHPDATDNFRSAIGAEQAIFNPLTRSTIRAATLSRDAVALTRAQVDADLALAVITAYGRALVTTAARDAAGVAVDSARADRDLAVNRRDAGLVTDADVLMLDVQVARTLEVQIQADADARVARARLNQVMGEPLDALFTLSPLAPQAPVDERDTAALELEALQKRPDVQLAALHIRLATTAQQAARAAFLPQVVAQAAWEGNGGAWTHRASSWIAGVTARVTLFDGAATRARISEARAMVTRQTIDQERVETNARLEIRLASAELETARAREVVTRTATQQARESHRILRDRYDAGLADVTSLLHAADIARDAEVRHITAEVDIVVATAALRRALGRQ